MTDGERGAARSSAEVMSSTPTGTPSPLRATNSSPDCRTVSSAIVRARSGESAVARTTTVSAPVSCLALMEPANAPGVVPVRPRESMTRWATVSEVMTGMRDFALRSASWEATSW